MGMSLAEAELLDNSKKALPQPFSRKDKSDLMEIEGLVALALVSLGSRAAAVRRWPW